MATVVVVLIAANSPRIHCHRHYEDDHYEHYQNYQNDHYEYYQNYHDDHEEDENYHEDHSYENFHNDDEYECNDAVENIDIEEKKILCIKNMGS